MSEEPEIAIATAEDFDPDGSLSRAFLLRRGRCCEEGCRHCPYGFQAKEPARPVEEERS